MAWSGFLHRSVGATGVMGRAIAEFRRQISFPAVSLLMVEHGPGVLKFRGARPVFEAVVLFPYNP
jgi:hypothetical protein